MEMDLKRAINIITMPNDWFNTPQKAELRNKAVRYIDNHPDLQEVYYGRVTLDDITGAKNEGKRRLNEFIQSNPESKRMKESIEREGKNHQLDREIIAASEITKKYGIYDGRISDEALSTINDPQHLSNSALRHSLVNDRNPDGSFTNRTVLEEYRDNLTRMIEQMRSKDSKELKKLGISEEQRDKDANYLKTVLDKVVDMKKSVDTLDGMEKKFIREAQAPLIEKQKVFDKSFNKVCEELGLPVYTEEEMRKDPVKRENYYRIRDYLDRLHSYKYLDYTPETEYRSSTIKNTANYRTSPKDAPQLKLEDDGRDDER